MPNFYLALPGYSGPQSSAGPSAAGAFQIDSFDFGVTAAPAPQPGAQEQVAAAHPGDVTVHFTDHAGLTVFLDLLEHDGSLAKASLLTTDGGLNDALLDVSTLSNVKVTSVTEGGADGFSVTLSYADLSLTVRNAATDNHPQMAHWNVAAGTVDTTVATQAQTGGDANTSVAPTTFYLLVDGVDGGSRDAGHVGWFKLNSFDLAAVKNANGAISAKSLFDAVNVSFDGASGAPALLAKLAGQSVFAGARIEGIAGGDKGQPAVAVYDLDLVNVRVTDLHQTDGDTSASLAFDAFQLKTIGAGAKAPTHIDSWDIVHQSDTVHLPTIAPGGPGDQSLTPGTFLLEVTGLSSQDGAALRPGAFTVENFDFDIAALIHRNNSGDIQPGAAQPGHITVHLTEEDGMTAFLDALEKGTAFSAVSLYAPFLGGHGDSYRLNLEHVTVAGVTDNGADGLTVTLAYSEIGMQVTNLASGGGLSTPQTADWDVVGHTVDATMPTAAQAGGVAVYGSHPVTYYLLLDGVNGGSTGLNHVNWFALTSFDMSAHGGKFDTVDVGFDAASGVPRIIEQMVRDEVFAGARIEGVDANGNAVFDLNLANVSVAAVSQQDGNSTASLGFTAFQVTTGGGAHTSSDSWNIAAGNDSVSLPSIHTGSGGRAVAADTFYFTLPGVAGPTSGPVQGASSAFQVTSFSVDAQNPLDGSGAPTTASAGDLHLHFANEAGMTAFLDRLESGTGSGTSALIGTATVNSHAVETYRLELTNTVVTSVSDSASGGFDVTLHGDQLAVDVHDIRSDLSQDAAQIIDWNVLTDMVDGALPAAGAPGGARYLNMPTPVAYYLLVDGVKGDVTTAGHVGWFTLTDFTFSGSGPNHFDTVTVAFDGVSGTPATLADLVRRTAIAGVRIEGVDRFGHAVYDLDLVNVRASNLTEDNGNTSQAFTFGAFQLKTVDGGGTASTDSWNLDTQTNTVVLPSIAPGDGGIGAPPAAPTGLHLDAASDTGVAGDGVTRLTTITIDGSAAAGSTVALYDGALQVGSAVADGSGAFQATVSGLSAGGHTFTATATNNVGASGASAGLTVTVDTTPPGPPANLSLDASTDTGAVGDNVTGVTVLKIDGQAEGGASVTLYDGATPVGTATADGGGAFQVTTTTLISGAHTLTAVATDAAGNVGSASGPLAVTLKTLAFPGDAATHGVAELGATTGSAALDQTSFNLAFTDADLTAHHGVALGSPTITGPAGVTLPAGLASAVANALTVAVTDSTGTGSGSLGVAFAAPDKTFDFLAQGQTLTLSYQVTLSDDHGGSVVNTVTIQVTGADDAPQISAAVSGAATEGGPAVKLDALAGATDPEGDALSVTGLPASLPAGVTWDAASHSLSLDPANAAYNSLKAGATQVVSVSYGVTDGTLTTPQTLQWTVTGTNDAPTAKSDTATTAEKTPVTIDVLANDTDPDTGDTLTISSATASQGSSVQIVDNKLVFTPGASFDLLTLGQSGAATIAYTIKDGSGATSTASVLVKVAGVADGADITNLSATSITGTGLDEKITGGDGGVVIHGLDGADKLFGGAGADQLFGDAGYDQLSGGGGNDTLDGGTGNDTLTGGAGADRFVFSGTGFGADQITDFTAGDLIEFHGSFASYADVMAHATQSGANVLITLDALDTVLLKNVTLGSLTNAAFVFS